MPEPHPALLEQIVYIFGLLLIEFSKHLRELVKKLFKSGDICHIDLPEKWWATVPVIEKVMAAWTNSEHFIERLNTVVPSDFIPLYKLLQKRTQVSQVFRCRSLQIAEFPEWSLTVYRTVKRYSRIIYSASPLVRTFADFAYHTWLFCLSVSSLGQRTNDDSGKAKDANSGWFHIHILLRQE